MCSAVTATAFPAVRAAARAGSLRAMAPRTNASAPPRSATKRRVARFVTNRLVNPLVRTVLEHARMPGWALLETTGRRSGLPRRVPLGDGLRDHHFWIVTEHGYAAHYVKNIQADPRVRVKTRGRWRTGTARILPDDDPATRLRWLGRPVNDTLLRLVGTQQLTIRVDLDR
jgi:deazaflavin-dependent oxidoreductase (nitroreductase family)